MTNSNITEEEIKLLRSMAFANSEVFDAVLTIINNNIEYETTEAISSMSDESLRAHACGRADGMKSLRERLIAYNETAREFKLAGKI